MSFRLQHIANPPATGVYVHDVCMTGQGERSEYMARRKSYQNGTVFTRGKKGNAVWVGRWWEYGLARDGAPRRVRRSRVLGRLTELRSRREAQRCLDRDLSKANSGRQRAESKMKFRDFIEGRWINDVLPAHKLSTRLQYRYFMDRHLLPYFGEWKLEDIRPEEVQRFLRLLPKLAPKTVRNMAAALSSSLRTAVTWGYLETNPVRGVSLPAKRSVRERRALSMEEVSALLGKLQEPCRTAVILMLLTGMRIGEVLALRWGKIDWQRQTIIVDEGLYEGEISTPKTASGVRVLPMTKVLLNALRRWKTRKTVDAADFIFPSAVGTGLCRRNLSNRFLKPAATAAGIGNISWHMLRRTHSTWLKDVGATPGVIQHQLGHSDPRLAFELYVMSVPGERRRAVDRVSSQLKRLLDPNSTHAPIGVLSGESRNALPSAG
jgi:integrase